MSEEWKLVLDEEPLNLLLSCRSAERQRLLKALTQLRDDPYQHGDYTEKDDESRDLQVKLMGLFLVSYWTDSFVKEMRIVDIDRVRLPV